MAKFEWISQGKGYAYTFHGVLFALPATSFCDPAPG
jgi:hypothetical protein